ncbi:putative BPI/LBP family protein [Corchorus capsularis]|uniref:Putative BPI/LBP family protein n=1 Tax=Corchorus capsularis TaxID=210143 RepID=A0A1R3GM94_COCAP|nr:putative BPI/LBP family protein [Corchorus capsularis]
MVEAMKRTLEKEEVFVVFGLVLCILSTGLARSALTFFSVSENWLAKIKKIPIDVIKKVLDLTGLADHPAKQLLQLDLLHQSLVQILRARTVFSVSLSRDDALNLCCNSMVTRGNYRCKLKLSLLAFGWLKVVELRGRDLLTLTMFIVLDDNEIHGSCSVKIVGNNLGGSVELDDSAISSMWSVELDDSAISIESGPGSVVKVGSHVKKFKQGDEEFFRGRNKAVKRGSEKKGKVAEEIASLTVFVDGNAEEEEEDDE